MRDGSDDSDASDASDDSDDRDATYDSDIIDSPSLRHFVTSSPERHRRAVCDGVGGVGKRLPLMTLSIDLRLALPDWVAAVDDARPYPDDDAKMTLAIDLARRNVEAESGGPFGAAVFDADDRALAVGVNCVLPQTCSLAHAETMACMLAQRHAGRVRLNQTDGGESRAPITLATSAQPCCQCYGALVWAGIDRLLIGANSEDVESLVGFDEGPLPVDWVGELERRGIEVVRDLHRAEVCKVLQAYAERGGPTY